MFLYGYWEQIVMFSAMFGGLEVCHEVSWVAEVETKRQTEVREVAISYLKVTRAENTSPPEVL